MTDQPKLSRKTILVLTAFALLLQLTVMILLATDRITVALAIPLLASVVIFGLVPARSTAMTDQPKPGRKTFVVLTNFAALLQTTVIVLLTIDRITVALAIPMLALVVIVGLLPAMAWIKSNK